jgi:DNA-directed RNA polymerase subunit M/transcription elongation factor TFIIS
MASHYHIPNPEKFRTNVEKQIGQLIESEDPLLYVNIEKSIYNYAIQEATRRNIVKKWTNPSFVTIYIDRFRSVFLNLKTDRGGIVHQLKTGELEPSHIAFMSHYEMHPTKWNDIMEKKRQRDVSRLNTTIEANTDMYTCRRCKSKRTSYYEMATRSADEQMTIFITCLDCGKNWRQ